MCREGRQRFKECVRPNRCEHDRTAVDSVQSLPDLNDQPHVAIIWVTEIIARARGIKACAPLPRLYRP